MADITVVLSFPKTKSGSHILLTITTPTGILKYNDSMDSFSRVYSDKEFDSAESTGIYQLFRCHLHMNGFFNDPIDWDAVAAELAKQTFTL